MQSDPFSPRLSRRQRQVSEHLLILNGKAFQTGSFLWISTPLQNSSIRAVVSTSPDYTKHGFQAKVTFLVDDLFPIGVVSRKQ